MEVKLSTLEKGELFRSVSGKIMHFDYVGYSGIVWATDTRTGRRNCYSPSDRVRLCHESV